MLSYLSCSVVCSFIPHGTSPLSPLDSKFLRSAHGSILFVPSTPSCGPSAEDPGHAHAMPSLLCLRIAGYPLLFLSCLFVCSRLLLCSSHIATFDCQQRSPFIPTVYIHKLSIMHISPLVSFSYTHALLLPVFCRPRLHRLAHPRSSPYHLLLLRSRVVSIIENHIPLLFVSPFSRLSTHSLACFDIPSLSSLSLSLFLLACLLPVV